MVNPFDIPLEWGLSSAPAVFRKVKLALSRTAPAISSPSYSLPSSLSSPPTPYHLPLSLLPLPLSSLSLSLFSLSPLPFSSPSLFSVPLPPSLFSFQPSSLVLLSLHTIFFYCFPPFSSTPPTFYLKCSLEDQSWQRLATLSSSYTNFQAPCNQTLTTR